VFILGFIVIDLTDSDVGLGGWGGFLPIIISIPTLVKVELGYDNLEGHMLEMNTMSLNILNKMK
jgi:hypothetical protein